ncbi:MAG: Holliday junction branch migration protein RuvA [Lachnospiraceae bacterium]|nr:Holliday junction branch migration protein RuvA [Lachnospiraceae bacterium]
MIAFIEGELEEVNGSSVVIGCGGIGYEVVVSGQVLEKLPNPGGQVKLYTYLQMREDGVTLFGFLDRDTLSVFRQLIGVNGIGPKAAVGILSALTADDLRFAVLAEDERTIAKAPGIGAKTAKKLILELKDKFRLEDAFEKKLMRADAKEDLQESPASDYRGMVLETIQALEALGFSGAQARRMVNSVEGAEELTADGMLKAALKHA